MITAIAEMSLIYFSPIDNENRKLNWEECREYPYVLGFYKRKRKGKI